MSGNPGLVEFQLIHAWSVGGFIPLMNDPSNPTWVTEIKVPLSGFYAVTTYVSANTGGENGNAFSLAINISDIADSGTSGTTATVGGLAYVYGGVGAVQSGENTLYNQVILPLNAGDRLSVVNASDNATLVVTPEPASGFVNGGSGVGESVSMRIDYLGPVPI